jgi:hypothetical protein
VNILFLSLQDFDDINVSGIYTDLIREFIKHNHQMYVVSPTERKNKKKTSILKFHKLTIIKLKIGNFQKTNIIEKGLTTLFIESSLKRGVARFTRDVKFDLVIYSTPPITFTKSINYVKKRDNANSYLLLKDIFPQNAVDLGMLSKDGIKGVIYKYFRKKEKRLYQLSDCIGCMSNANVNYIKKENIYLGEKVIELCPNSIELKFENPSSVNTQFIYEKYNIPIGKKYFVYGGNLGKPQGIQYMLNAFQSVAHLGNVHFLVIGSGTEYKTVEHQILNRNMNNITLISHLPKNEFDEIMKIADVGLIFLDKRFTIPNFPSRLLSYMENSLPVITMTDAISDVGETVEKGQFGYSCISDDINCFIYSVEKLLTSDNVEFKRNSKAYLLDFFTVNKTYDIIMKHFEDGMVVKNV